jgi:hypothetical protein
VVAAWKEYLARRGIAAKYTLSEGDTLRVVELLLMRAEMAAKKGKQSEVAPSVKKAQEMLSRLPGQAGGDKRRELEKRIGAFAQRDEK